MPRFYFHMRMGDHVEADTDGTELANLAEAKQEALQSAREILANAIMASQNTINEFLIADESGQELATVCVKDALPKDVC
jgi:hypothetical protein